MRNDFFNIGLTPPSHSGSTPYCGHCRLACLHLVQLVATPASSSPRHDLTITSAASSCWCTAIRGESSSDGAEPPQECSTRPNVSKRIGISSTQMISTSEFSSESTPAIVQDSVSVAIVQVYSGGDGCGHTPKTMTQPTSWQHAATAPSSEITAAAHKPTNPLSLSRSEVQRNRGG